MAQRSPSPAPLDEEDKDAADAPTVSQKKRQGKKARQERQDAADGQNGSQTEEHAEKQKDTRTEAIKVVPEKEKTKNVPEGTEGRLTFKDLQPGFSGGEHKRQRKGSVFNYTDEDFIDANAESTCRDTPQKYLNAIHDANLLLQRSTEAYETIKAANELSEQGFQKRNKLCEDSRNKPEFFLNFGPAGDLPIHLACLLQDGQLGIDMLEAVHYSHKIDAYYDRCHKLIEMYGQENMPALPKEKPALAPGEKCPRCDWRKGHGDAHLPAHLPAHAAKHHENCKHWHVHRFIINIPYQNDILWWLKEMERRLKEIERRKDSSGEGSESLEEIERRKKVEGDLGKLLPDNIRREMVRKGREAGLFSGETLLHVAIAKREPKLIKYLLDNGANVYAQAVGNFFQPKRGEKLLDFHQGTYYGPTPLCFAASLSRGRRIITMKSLDEKESEEKIWANLLPLLMKHAQKEITDGLNRGWRLDCKTLRELESNLFSKKDTQSKRRMGIFSFCGCNKVNEEQSDQNADFNGIESLSFLDQLVWQWYTLCHETNVEDWLNDSTASTSPIVTREKKYFYFRKEFFKSDSDPSDDAVECAEWSQEFRDQVAQDLLVAFVNTRDKYGNSAMHLAVEHHNDSSLQFLLKKQDVLKEDLLKTGAGNAEDSSAVVGGNESAGNEFNEFSGLGRASLTLLNWKNFTPFSSSVHLARVDDKKSLNSYRTILECGYRQTVWQFGVHDMRITSLYQIDTFRVRSKRYSNKLHENPNYSCILQVVVDHEVPVLNDLPELEELVAEKWNKFAFWQYMQKAVLPYCVIVVAITVAIVNRIEDLKEHTHVLYAGPVLEYDRRDQFQIAVEVIVYLLGVPFLLYNAWAASRLGLVDTLLLGKGTGRNGILFRLLDVNLDGKVSYDECTMYVFKNLDSVFSTAIACLLAAAAAIRLSSHPHWLRVSAECYEEETMSSWRLSQELDLLSVAALCAWLNVLFMLVPFKAPGLVLIALFRMLSRDVVKWLFLYLIILCAFSLSGLAMLYDFVGDTDASSLTSHAHARLRKTSRTEEFAASLVTWPDMLKFFIWSSVGEVNPGSVLVNARNPETALTLYLCFVVLSTLVLMNLLISLMSNTFATDTAHGRQIWWFEFAALVLRYEARLSEDAKQRYRCGTFIRQRTLERGKHDVEWYDVKYKNTKESQDVRKWRKQIIKNEVHKDFINDKFSELQEKFHQIEILLKNKSKPSATPPLPPLKEEEARKRREVAAREMASAPPEGIPTPTDTVPTLKSPDGIPAPSEGAHARTTTPSTNLQRPISRTVAAYTVEQRVAPPSPLPDTSASETADASVSGAQETQEGKMRRSRRTHQEPHRRRKGRGDGADATEAEPSAELDAGSNGV